MNIHIIFQNNSIIIFHTDAAYKAFLESQEKVEEKEALDVEQYLEELEKREKKNEVNETPLTLYMKQKAIERKVF